MSKFSFYFCDNSFNHVLQNHYKLHTKQIFVTYNSNFIGPGKGKRPSHVLLFLATCITWTKKIDCYLEEGRVTWNYIPKACKLQRYLKPRTRSSLTFVDVIKNGEEIRLTHREEMEDALLEYHKKHFSQERETSLAQPAISLRFGQAVFSTMPKNFGTATKPN